MKAKTLRNGLLKHVSGEKEKEGFLKHTVAFSFDCVGVMFLGRTSIFFLYGKNYFAKFVAGYMN